MLRDCPVQGSQAGRAGDIGLPYEVGRHLLHEELHVGDIPLWPVVILCRLLISTIRLRA
jgi:hypothetical protein